MPYGEYMWLKSLACGCVAADYRDPVDRTKTTRYIERKAKTCRDPGHRQNQLVVYVELKRQTTNGH